MNFGNVSNHPELIDLNYVSSKSLNTGGADWIHINSIDYNEKLDQILVSVHGFNEIWIIDHSTTTEEANSHLGGNSGKGGDLLYRWGNNQTYLNSDENQIFYGQYDAEWTDEGNILVYNNGSGREGEDYSTVEEIVTSVNENGDYEINFDYQYTLGHKEI